MRIIAVRERTVPIASLMSNAVISFAEMTVSLVAIVTDAWRDDARVIGFGFNSNGRYAQGGLLRERLIPRLMRASPDELLDDGREGLDPHRAWQVLMRNEKPGGHGDRAVAMGILDMALWDIAAKLQGVPLAVLIARRYGCEPVRSTVPVYAAGGYYYPQGGTAQLRDEVQSYLDLGYTSVKIKIAGAELDEDLGRIDAVLSLIGDPSRLAVDANGRLSPAEAGRWTEALAPIGLRWFEEPGDPLDYALLHQVAEGYAPALATGENLFSLQEVVNLLRYGGLRPDRDVLQMDPALSYGLVEFLRIIEALESFGWQASSCIPHGGHQLNLAIAAGLGLGGVESYPGLFAPFGGFADGQPVVDGVAQIADVPGVGIEAKAELYRLGRELVSDYA